MLYTMSVTGSFSALSINGVNTNGYTIDNDNRYPYYASELKPYHANDTELSPNRELPKLGPIMTDNGLMEHEMDKIIVVGLS